jgi:hypothetical protein
LDQITELLPDRYRAMSATDVLGSIAPLNLLFAWRQGGDEQGPRGLVETNIVSDQGFVETLEHLTSTIDSSDRGAYDILKRDNLDPFMNYENVKKRLDALSGHSELGERAKWLEIAFNYGTQH